MMIKHMRWIKYISTKSRIILISLILFSSAEAVIQPLIIKQALYIPTHPTWKDIGQLTLFGLVTYLVIYLLGLATNIFLNYLIARKVAFGISNEILAKFLNHVGINRTNSEEISNLSQDLDVYRDSFVFQQLQLLIRGGAILAVSVYLLYIDSFLGIIFIAGSFLIPIPQTIANKKIVAKGEALATTRARSLSKIMDAVNGKQTIQNNEAVKEINQNVNESVEFREKARAEFGYLYNIAYAFNGITFFLGQILPLIIGFIMIANGVNIGIPALISMYIAAQQLSNPIQVMIYAWTDIKGSDAVRQKLEVIIDNGVTEEAQKIEVKNIASLEVENISKHFSGKTVIQNFSASFEMGKKYLIRGASGSGKTTLFELINQEVSLDGGKIKVIDADGNSYLDFQKNVGVISQTPFLFNDTIRFNLTLGQNFADRNLQNVLSQVGLTEEFEDVLNVEIENNGENISGGQRVRIEIARFLLRKKGILLVDEVTASLDEKNSAKIRGLIMGLPVMVLEIAHHINQDVHYDGVIEFDKQAGIGEKFKNDGKSKNITL